MSVEIDFFITWFNTYARDFISGDQKDVENVRIKLHHSLRVLDNAECIADSLPELTELAGVIHCAALLHDVGRFPQYEQYRTFNDRESVNHAALGVKVLSEQKVLQGLDPHERKLVLGAVGLHNRCALPSRMHPELFNVVTVVRDADKLDIFTVALEHLKPGAEYNSVVMLNLKPHPTAFSRNILDDVFAKNVIRYQDMVWTNDLKLILCSWFYDLHYEMSRQIAVERGYVEEIFSYLPMNHEFNELKKNIFRDLSFGG